MTNTESRPIHCNKPMQKAGTMRINKAGDRKQLYKCPECFTRVLIGPVLNKEGVK
jgi:hypothetical protein